VNRQTLSIAGRATSALIRTQGIGDLYRIYSVSQRDDVDSNLASMPTGFDVKRRYAFDPEYMRPLFQLRYDMGKAGHPWAKVPPGFGELDKAQVQEGCDTLSPRPDRHHPALPAMPMHPGNGQSRHSRGG
jgi:hypothetical protein